MKKVLILLVSVFLFAMMSFMVSGVCDPPKVCGDADGNGVVNILDASLAARKAAGLSVTIDIDCAKVTGGSSVSILDAQQIARKAAGLPIQPRCPMSGGGSSVPVEGPGAPVGSCSDGRDNDGDYFYDKADTDCFTAPGVTPRVPSCGDAVVQTLAGERCEIVPAPRLGLYGEPDDLNGDGRGDAFACGESGGIPGRCVGCTACDYSAPAIPAPVFVVPAMTSPVSTPALSKSPIISRSTISRSTTRISPIGKATDVIDFLPSEVSSIATMLVLFGLLVSLIFLFKRD